MSQKSLFIITGSSRGFGRAIAIALSQTFLTNINEEYTVVLISRDMDELKATKNIMLENLSKGISVTVEEVFMDLSKSSVVEESTASLLANMDKDYKFVYFFNNAGVIGDLTKTLIDYNSYSEIEKIFNVNTVSGIYLISRICNHFKSCKVIIIQTSSMFIVQPFPYFSLYGSSKAGMEFALKNLALEHANIRCLNYAPGPMATDMLNETTVCSQYVNDLVIKLKNDGAYVNPLNSALKLLGILQNDKFNSGGHIDFFDKVE